MSDAGNPDPVPAGEGDLTGKIFDLSDKSPGEDVSVPKHSHEAYWSLLDIMMHNLSSVKPYHSVYLKYSYINR